MSDSAPAKLKLYYFNGCLYCLMVRVAIRWFGLDICRREVLFDLDNRADLETGGGKFQVPCLRIETREGEVTWMYESLRIIRFLRKIKST